ncbi:MAG: squalene--hopene cyclase [Planctomycetaceae bacterium]|nr:squalene--hopene cyclase [Planctomycetaceae bacterium]
MLPQVFTTRHAESQTGLSTTDELQSAIAKTRTWLLDSQHEEGYWLGELEGDTILESEYVLLLTYLGRGDSEIARKCAASIWEQQIPTGGWSLYPGGPLEMSASVKAYWVLKIAGYDPNSPEMQLAREAILAHGGAERVNSFTRFYMALLGLISYQQCPAVPPELILLPSWCPFNIYEMSSWSRTILVPLSLLWAFQPQKQLPPEHQIDELFLKSPAELPVTMPPAEQVDEIKQKTWLPWRDIFATLDRTWKTVEGLGIKPLRSVAVRRAADWIIERFEQSDGLGAIFPPIIWSIVALKCLGHDDDSEMVRAALYELEKLTIEGQDTAHLEPCRSPVWDTAIATLALREAGVPSDEPRVRRAVDWLLSKEVRQRGDWSVRKPHLQPGGWYFEFNNEFYPDIDDSIMVSMALAKCLPGEGDSDWTALLLPKEGKSSAATSAFMTAFLGKAESAAEALLELDQIEPVVGAVQRAARWVLGMQCRNGGWAAFDADNTRELLTLVPFADHNAMIDPPTADITARVLEMCGRLGMTSNVPALKRALNFVWSQQEEDGSWYGRWGVNYIYGTWQVLVGLQAFGESMNDPRAQRGADWLESIQQQNGGWGESPASYDHPQLRGIGETTASQTAWALLGLMAAGRGNSESVRRGVQYLINSQLGDGTWHEPQFTGTGFPRVFYLRYHLYRIYFPLMALGRYSQYVQNQTTEPYPG